MMNHKIMTSHTILPTLMHGNAITNYRFIQIIYFHDMKVPCLIQDSHSFKPLCLMQTERVA